MSTKPRNPKRLASKGSVPWYGYYAGYSKAFVEDALDRMHLPPGSVVMDPWNGSGTTTKVAHERGYYSIGFDINPVMILISKARLLPPDRRNDIHKVARGVILLPEEPSETRVYNDPLNVWLTSSATSSVRALEKSIRQALGILDSVADSSSSDMSAFGAVESFFYVALFRTLNTLLAPFKTSNPAWIKYPKEHSERISPTASQVEQVFLGSVDALLDELVGDWTRDPQPDLPEVRLEVASSLGLSETLSHPVNAVISSPPYCTRLDYVRATAAELAVLGYTDNSSLRQLRDTMIGTPTVSKATIQPNLLWGKTCWTTLELIANHSSKASSTYYLKTYMQYFHSVFLSLTELNRVVAPGGHVALVVQDSYYKDIHVDLPLIYEEMAQVLGWTVADRYDFSVANSISQVHPGRRTYRQTSQPTESALFFNKPYLGGV